MSYYSVILGFNASTTARSPTVWNQKYNDKKINALMKPIDVNDEKDFEEKFAACLSDPECLGGAIAVPYKSIGAKLSITSNASINCFFKRDKNKFIGINTDGQAAYECIKGIKNSFDYKNILVLGNGATAHALLETMKVDAENQVVNYVRTIKESMSSLNILQKKFDEIYDEEFNENTLIVNCTSVGGPMDPNGKLLDQNKFSNKKNLDKLHIFDINQLDELNSLGMLCKNLNISYENGIKMNRLQAEIAFKEVNNILL
jgi:shikimate 5-dehydrogenase